MSDKTKYLVEETGSGIDIFLLLNILKKNFVLFLLVFTMLFSTFLFYIFFKKQEFYSSFPISINQNVSNFVINNLKNTTKLSKNELKKILELTQDEYQDLNFIQVTNIKIIEDIHTATINVSTKQPKNIKPIADKLMIWINNNPEITAILEAKTTSTQELLAKTNEQLAQIKTIKDLFLNAPVKSESTFSFIEEYRILEYKNKLDQDIDALKTVIVLTSHYFMPIEPKNNSKKIPLFLAFMTSMLLSIITTILLKYKKA